MHPDSGYEAGDYRHALDMHFARIEEQAERIALAKANANAMALTAQEIADLPETNHPKGLE